MAIEEFLGLSLTKISKITGVNKGTLSKYFSPDKPETPTWNNISKMSQELGMSAELLMEAINEKRLQNYEKLKTKVSKAQLSLIQSA